MAKAVLPVEIRRDRPRRAELCRILAALRGDVEDEFWFAVCKMEHDKYTKADGVALLDGRFQTYGLDLGGLGPLLLVDFDAQDRRWTLLWLLLPPGLNPEDHLVGGQPLDVLPAGGLADRLYRECCPAHGLVSPTQPPR